jgi:hypothetical protein
MGHRNRIGHLCRRCFVANVAAAVVVVVVVVVVYWYYHNH